MRANLRRNIRMCSRSGRFGCHWVGSARAVDQTVCILDLLQSWRNPLPARKAAIRYQVIGFINNTSLRTLSLASLDMVCPLPAHGAYPCKRCDLETFSIRACLTAVRPVNCHTFVLMSARGAGAAKLVGVVVKQLACKGLDDPFPQPTTTREG
jgi:hypothetical protein